jgi:hypothetical protein
MGGQAKVPAPSAEERALQKAQSDLLNQQRQIIEAQQAQQKILLPFLAEQEGYNVELDEMGNIKKISKTPNETETLRNTLDKELAEHSLKALRGELPVDPALEQSLTEQQQTLRERLSAQLGTGYETSSAGIEALGKFDANASSLRSAARKGELTLSEQLGLAREQQNDYSRMSSQDFLRQIGVGDPVSFAGAYGQIASGYGQAQQPYIQQRSLQYQASQQSKNNMYGLLGSAIGAAGSVFASPAGSAFLFSDESLKEDAVPISWHARLGVPIYTYTIGGVQKIGVFAGDVEAKRPNAVNERYGYKTVNYEAL